MTTMAAVDIGAQSGRVVVGRLDGGRLGIEEVHRFPNHPVTAGGRLHWDILQLYEQVVEGITAAGRFAGDLDSVGVDTWGVDFGLLDGDGTLLGNPVHHRDRRTEGVMERVFARVPPRELYERTGIQLLPINTIFQLAAVVEGGGRALAAAHRLLLVPDLLHYWLSGVAVCERTNASTTQCLDPRSGEWATDLLERLDIPAAPFRELVEPGTVLGRLRDDVADRTGLRDTRVAVPGTHDTASAVAAVPFRDPGAAYISAGTWSLVGVELHEPLINDDAFAANLTNEGGVGGTTRLLRNVDGLWLLHECRNAWAAEGRTYTFEELVSAAEATPAAPLLHRAERAALPGAGRPARAHPRVLPRDRPARAGRCGGGHTLHPREPCPEARADGAPARRRDRLAPARDPHRRRRRAERAALPLDGRGGRPAGARRPRGGDRGRQPRRAGDRARRARLARRGA